MLPIMKPVQEWEPITKISLKIVCTKAMFSLHHLHIYHTFFDLYKILKFKTPVTIQKLFQIIRQPNFNLAPYFQWLELS